MRIEVCLFFFFFFFFSGSHLTPVLRLMAIGRSVSGGLWSAFVDCGSVFDYRLSGEHMYKYTCLCVKLDTL